MNNAEQSFSYQPPSPPLLARLFSSLGFSLVIYVAVLGVIGYTAYSGSEAMGYNWQWYRIPQYLYSFTDDGFQFGEIVLGLFKTLDISFFSMLLAILIGLLIALLRLSDLIVGKAVSIVFLEIIRNMPLLVLLYLFYYVLGPIFGLSRYYASILCLGVYHGALLSEIFRAGINAIPKGQWEGSASIGMTAAQTYRYIILPQSIRFMIPPITGEVVNMIKSSAIVSVIAVAELTTIGRNIISDTYMSFEVWFTIAIVYLIVTVLFSIFASFVEKAYATN